MYNRTYNFSAGPATMPVPVLEEIRDELLNYRGAGMGVMEMSHRSKVFQTIIDEAEQDLRDLMGIPDNYKVLFIQGGATLQFAMIPMNLMKNGKAIYIETGAWSKKAIAEAKKYGEVNVAASSKDRNYAYIPDCSDLPVEEDTDYVYICENETIHGTTWQKLPDTKGKPLVSVPVQAVQCFGLRHDLCRCPEERRPRRYGHRHHPRGSDPRGPRSQDADLHDVQDPCGRGLHV